MFTKTVERALEQAAKDLALEAGLLPDDESVTLKDEHDPLGYDDSLYAVVETRMVEAAWTLRRLPDREASFIYAKQVMWPDVKPDGIDNIPEPLTTLQARKRVRLTPKAIDRMQPTLDLLHLLPDQDDRRILFWGAWHQDGEVQSRIPWAKVRRSMRVGLSRWTLKRRYSDSIAWLSRVICMQR